MQKSLNSSSSRFPATAMSMVMAESNHLHFVLVPLMAPGHLIPMADMAKLFAERDIFVSLVTTPVNARRLSNSVVRARESGHQIELVTIPFPCTEVGLPQGCENLDSLPSPCLISNFYAAINRMQQPLEIYLSEHKFPPSCIVSDRYISWTLETCNKFRIPRLVFHGMSCFSLLSCHNILLRSAHNSVVSDDEPFEVPAMPVNMKFQIKKVQLPGAFVALPNFDDTRIKINESESASYGVVVNSFRELENGCDEEYREAINRRVYCVGPVSLCNKESMDKFARGNLSAIDENECLNWLEARKPSTVLYACLGSQCRLVPNQLMELGLALEASKHPFVWVIKAGEKFSEMEKWLQEQKFEERIKGRGLVIKGWAPQIQILSHASVRAFLTHCGWNSTIEGLCSGVPMITWPLFAEQFINEKMVVDILQVGIRVGAEVPVRWGHEEKVGVLVKKKDIEKAIDMVMDGGEEGRRRRIAARQYAELASRAVVEGGTSHASTSLLIQDIISQITSQD